MKFFDPHRRSPAAGPVRRRSAASPRAGLPEALRRNIDAGQESLVTDSWSRPDVVWRIAPNSHNNVWRAPRTLYPVQRSAIRRRRVCGPAELRPYAADTHRVAGDAVVKRAESSARLVIFACYARRSSTPSTFAWQCTTGQTHRHPDDYAIASERIPQDPRRCQLERPVRARLLLSRDGR